MDDGNYDSCASINNMINDLELERLENRRNDWLTLVFKALQGHVGICREDINITFCNTCTQAAHSMKLQYQRSSTTQYCNWFFTCTILEWNI